MKRSTVRPMRPTDWVPVPIAAGRYCNPAPMTGFRRRDGQGGNPLHPAQPLFPGQGVHTTPQARYPQVHAARYTVHVPYWTGPMLPGGDDYCFVERPRPLTTTSVTVIMVAQSDILSADMGFYFRDHTLPSLRERMRGVRFRGLAGNLGYYMTAALIQGKPWSHQARFPGWTIPDLRSYLGFHMFRDPATGQQHSSFAGAHPAAVAIRPDRRVEILPHLDIAGYSVQLCGQRVPIEAVNDPTAIDREVVLFTPGLRTPEVEALVAEIKSTAGTTEAWQRYGPTIPLADAADRTHLFVANRGNGRVPVEEIACAWSGIAPLPSFGAVLSFKRTYLDSLLNAAETSITDLVGQPLHIAPIGAPALQDKVQVMGGFVPVVVDGEHVYHVETVEQVMEHLDRYGNATSPIGEAGRESRNFDPYIREPAGLLFQTAHHVGWALFDGRHERSIGASVVDVAAILHKLQTEHKIPAIEQAILVDGGSAMKVYAVDSDGQNVRLDLLNQVAAGSRNGPGHDPEGLNLYTLLSLGLDPTPE